MSGPMPQICQLALVAALVLGLTWAVGPETPRPDGRGNVKSDFGVYPEPPPPALPRAGGKFLDPTFGAEIMRVTDERGAGNAGTSYSYWPTFNCDNTRIL